MRKGSPGEVAQTAFRTGMLAAAILGGLGIGGLYWAGTSLTMVVYLAVLLYPLYLVLAAAAINAWLGYGSDAIPLERVTVSPGSDGAGSSRDAGIERRRIERASGAAAGTATDPKTHLALIVGTAGTGTLLAVAGYHTIAFFTLMFSFLATVLWMLQFLWPRVETYYERRASRPGTVERVSAELKAGMTITALVCGLLVAVALLVSLVG